MESFDTISLQESIIAFVSPNVMWLALLVVISITILMSLMVIWHWDKYGVGLLRKAGTETVYIAVTGSLVFLVLVSVIVYVAGF